jgi:hypothetical protein
MNAKTLAAALFLCGLAIFLSPQYLTPPVVDSGVVWKSFSAEMLGYSEIFDTAADDIAAGKIKSDKDFFDQVNPKTGEARKAARAILDGYVQSRLPRDEMKLKPEAADFVRDLARQFMEASKR